MRASIMKYVRDEHGAIVSAELIIILTVVVLALVVDWNAVAARARRSRREAALLCQSRAWRAGLRQRDQGTAGTPSGEP